MHYVPEKTENSIKIGSGNAVKIYTIIFLVRSFYLLRRSRFAR